MYRRHSPGPLPSSTSNEFVVTSASLPHLLMWRCSHATEGTWGHVWVSMSQALLGELGTQLHLLKTVGPDPQHWAGAIFSYWHILPQEHDRPHDTWFLT